jgi:hypothetical protein
VAVEGDDSKEADTSEALGGLNLDGIREIGTDDVDEDGTSGDDVVEMPESDRWLAPRRSFVSFFLLRLSTIAAVTFRKVGHNILIRVQLVSEAFWYLKL